LFSGNSSGLSELNKFKFNSDCKEVRNCFMIFEIKKGEYHRLIRGITPLKCRSRFQK